MLKFGTRSILVVTAIVAWHPCGHVAWRWQDCSTWNISTRGALSLAGAWQLSGQHHGRRTHHFCDPWLLQWQPELSTSM